MDKVPQASPGTSSRAHALQQEIGLRIHLDQYPKSLESEGLWVQSPVATKPRNHTATRSQRNNKTTTSQQKLHSYKAAKLQTLQGAKLQSYRTQQLIPTCRRPKGGRISSWSSNKQVSDFWQLFQHLSICSGLIFYIDFERFGEHSGFHFR